MGEEGREERTGEGKKGEGRRRKEFSTPKNFGKGKCSHQGFLLPRTTDLKDANSSAGAQCSWEGQSVLSCDSERTDEL